MIKQLRQVLLKVFIEYGKSQFKVRQNTLEKHREVMVMNKIYKTSESVLLIAVI